MIFQLGGRAVPWLPLLARPYALLKELPRVPAELKYLLRGINRYQVRRCAFASYHEMNIPHLSDTSVLEIALRAWPNPK